MHLFLLLSIVWNSNAPWKEALTMDDPDYLPVPPIFGLCPPKKNMPFILCDLLSISSNPKFYAPQFLHELNNRVNVSQNINKLENLCKNDSFSQACMILGRIYEFGAYGIPENLTSAYQYYSLAGKLNSSTPNPMNAFYHRYINQSYARSVVEDDFYPNTNFPIESILASALQYETGFLRPLTCNFGAKLRLSLADVVSEMYIFPPSAPIDQKELQTLANSTDPKDMYRLSMYELSMPYPSKFQIKNAKNRLKAAYQKGFPKAASPIVFLHYHGYLPQSKTTRAKCRDMLQHALKLNDPLALMLTSNDYMTELKDSSENRYNPMLAKKYLRQAYEAGFPPAVHQYADFTYYGYLGIPRSNKDGFKIFKKAVAVGFIPSMCRAARQLLGGDGVMEDCPQATELLKRVLDIGPWSIFFDKYVKRGSRHAFQKMIDLGLTPSQWLGVESKTEAAEELMKVGGPVSKDLQSDFGVKWIRKAREGDEIATIYLIFMSPPAEALEWVERLKLLRPLFSGLVPIIKKILAAKWYYMIKINGDTEIEHLTVCNKEIAVLMKFCHISFVLLVLLLLLAARINMIFY